MPIGIYECINALKNINTLGHSVPHWWVYI